MRKENYSEDFGSFEHDWDFDFDFDFKFGVVEYCLMALYAIFILPFELTWTLGLKPLYKFIKYHAHKETNAKVSMIKEYHHATGPCCAWPKATH
ncbi:hypothetical protein [Desulfopila sp. IMCC35008]|uniref:hypothetical protein n=1 Tax=Desulfopila sp. IMCC35008 TaxID=2653858 RepID=UPI0013D46DE1|nr:hypothetical protein [Desulfopila sp. IMCC35008]